MMYSIWKTLKNIILTLLEIGTFQVIQRYQDEDGYFWFQGRVDDVIMTGERVGPFEVESKLVEHEAVVKRVLSVNQILSEAKLSKPLFHYAKAMNLLMS